MNRILTAPKYYKQAQEFAPCRCGVTTVLLSSGLTLTHWEIVANHICLNCSNAQMYLVLHCLAIENNI